MYSGERSLDENSFENLKEPLPVRKAFERGIEALRRSGILSFTVIG